MTPESERDWFTRALHARAFFHGTLLIATLHRALLENVPLPVECYAHQSEVIRNVNLSLDVPDRQLDEVTVAAVMCLGVFEVCQLGGLSDIETEYFCDQNITGQADATSMHIAGLRKLMTLRVASGRRLMSPYMMSFLHW